MIVLTHRGLDSDRIAYFKESSAEAFRDQLLRGFALEFDLQFTSDDDIVILHDPTLTRFSGGKNTAAIRDITLEALLALESDGCHLTSLSRLLEELRGHPMNGVHAIHVKSSNQSRSRLDRLLSKLENVDHSRFFLFDLTLEAAAYIRKHAPEISLAPSVAHPADIARYNAAVGGTLLSLYEVLAHADLFSWAWLDEWDRVDGAGGEKELYTPETFAALRKAGLRIAVITPELHRTSPALAGGESHSDARDEGSLSSRVREIIALQPDAICTDHPDAVRQLISPRPR